MGHDSQVPRELPEALRERSKESKPMSASVSASLAVLADWWPVLGQIYRDDPTAELAAAWREVLSPLPQDVLHEAILVGIRQSPEFRPKPGRIFEIAETIRIRRMQVPGQNRPKYLDAPKLSEGEREQELSTPEYQKLRQQITGKGA